VGLDFAPVGASAHRPKVIFAHGPLDFESDPLREAGRSIAKVWQPAFFQAGLPMLLRPGLVKLSLSIISRRRQSLRVLSPALPCALSVARRPPALGAARSNLLRIHSPAAAGQVPP